jgi:hypothetical protein
VAKNKKPISQIKPWSRGFSRKKDKFTSREKKGNDDQSK